MELATPGSTVRHASVARHVTDCPTRSGKNWNLSCRLCFMIPVYKLEIHIDSIFQTISTCKGEQQQTMNNQQR